MLKRQDLALGSHLAVVVKAHGQAWPIITSVPPPQGQSQHTQRCSVVPAFLRDSSRVSFGRGKPALCRLPAVASPLGLSYPSPSGFCFLLLRRQLLFLLRWGQALSTLRLNAVLSQEMKRPQRTPPADKDLPTLDTHHVQARGEAGRVRLNGSSPYAINNSPGVLGAPRSVWFWGQGYVGPPEAGCMCPSPLFLLKHVLSLIANSCFSLRDTSTPPSCPLGQS